MQSLEADLVAANVFKLGNFFYIVGVLSIKGGTIAGLT